MAGFDRLNANDQKQIRDIAKMAYGSGWFEGTDGGRGHIGILTVGGRSRVLKFNTHSDERGGTASEDMIRSGNALRNELIALADRAGLPPAVRNEIRSKLGLGPDGDASSCRDLLKRKIVAKVITMIGGAEAWKVSVNGRLETMTKANMAHYKSGEDMRFVKVQEFGAAQRLRSDDDMRAAFWNVGGLIDAVQGFDEDEISRLKADKDRFLLKAAGMRLWQLYETQGGFGKLGALSGRIREVFDEVLRECPADMRKTLATTDDGKVFVNAALRLSQSMAQRLFDRLRDENTGFANYCDRCEQTYPALVEEMKKRPLLLDYVVSALGKGQVPIPYTSIEKGNPSDQEFLDAMRDEIQSSLNQGERTDFNSSVSSILPDVNRGYSFTFVDKDGQEITLNADGRRTDVKKEEIENFLKKAFGVSEEKSAQYKVMKNLAPLFHQGIASVFIAEKFSSMMGFPPGARLFTDSDRGRSGSPMTVKITATDKGAYKLDYDFKVSVRFSNELHISDNADLGLTVTTSFKDPSSLKFGMSVDLVPEGEAMKIDKLEFSNVTLDVGEIEKIAYA